MRERRFIDVLTGKETRRPFTAEENAAADAEEAAAQGQPVPTDEQKLERLFASVGLSMEKGRELLTRTVAPEVRAGR